MTWKCYKDETELLEVYIKGLPDKGANVITGTIFLFCHKCWTFYKLIPEEMGEIQDIEIPLLEFQGLTQMELLKE